MRKHHAAFIALIALGVYGATSSAHSAAGPDRTATASAVTVNVTTTQRAVVFSQSRGFPKPGGKVVQLGFETTTGGPTTTTAVAVGRTAITGHPSRNVYTYRGTAESFSDAGVLRSELTGKFTFKRKRVIDSGRGHVTSGTGSLSGITGTFTISGNNPIDARVMTYVAKGTYTLP